MNILCVNSSPRIDGQSKTERLLNLLVEGMQEAKAEVDVVNLHQKKIRNCVGCFVIENGNISSQRGSLKNPDITIDTPFELWMDIITKKADGQGLNGEIPR